MGGSYLCDNKCGKSFDSVAMKNAHFTVCGGKIHVVPARSHKPRAHLPVQNLSLPDEAT